MNLALLTVGLFLFLADPAEIDRLYPLDAQLKVLADDVVSPRYRKRVLEEMLNTDLNAEWQRVETVDNADSFLEKHGGKDKVLADPKLKQAYERRLEIRKQFLDLMREGYQRFKKPAPFDTGAIAEKAATVAAKSTAPPVPVSIVFPSPGAEQQWPRFRGPDGQGITRTHNLPTTWSETENIVWRTPLPGNGNSSPIIWNQRIFLTSSGESGKERSLHCLDRKDGKLLWTRTVPDHDVEPNVRDKNGYASATPITDGERVIAFFGNGGLVCYDFEGKPLWHFPMPEFQTTWGTGASPLLYEDQVILVHDQNKADSLLLALDKRSGKLLWRHTRPKAMGWATPVVVRVGDRDELVYPGGTTVKGYDPRSGKELWSVGGATVEVVPSVLVGKDTIYSASGRQGPTLAIRPGGNGDVSATHLLWRTPRGGPHVPTPILVQGRIYAINDTGIVTCLNADDGKLVWQARLGESFSASPIECDGLLYCCSEEGKVYILRCGDKLDVVAENDMGAPILASPAALDSRLYIRTARELVCVGK